MKLTKEQIQDLQDDLIATMPTYTHFKIDDLCAQAKRANELAAECERLRGQLVLTKNIKQAGLNEAERRLAVANKWIRQHRTELDKDHACKECAPYSDILIDGFQCAYHAALQEVTK